MSSGQAETTKSGNFKRPDLQTVALWTKIAWEKIDAPLIVYSFKKCGISNNMDGTEDDILWTDQTEDENIEEIETDEIYCDIANEKPDSDSNADLEL